jgi:hypothetical protein
MSLILDALSRAEAEKRRQAVAVDILSPAPVTDAPSRPWGWFVALSVLLAGFLVMLFWFSGDASEGLSADRDAGAPAISDTGLGGATPVPTSPRSPDPLASRPAQGDMAGAATAVPREQLAFSASRHTPDPSQAEEIAALYARPVNRSERAEASTPAQPRIAGSSESSVNLEASAAAKAPQRQAQRAPPAMQLEAIDVERVLRDVRAEAESEAMAPHPAPLLASLSKQFRDGLPTLMYLRHDYSSRGPSTVLINGETLRVGQTSRGVEVLEILPDSVILRFKGTDFRLRALNSWVNL